MWTRAINECRESGYLYTYTFISYLIPEGWTLAIWNQHSNRSTSSPNITTRAACYDYDCTSV